jgi:biotin synthase
MTTTAINRNDTAPDSDVASMETSMQEAGFIYNLPFNDLLFRAQQVHRANFDPNAIQLSRLLKIAAIAASPRIIRQVSRLQS